MLIAQISDPHIKPDVVLGTGERARLVDDLNTMIMEEVERQQGAHPGS